MARIPRPSKDQYFLAMADLVSLRSTCVRRAVGCVLTDMRGHVLSTGYNGVAAGLPHCIDNPCGGADLPSGTGLDQCEAIHAEQNALLQCQNVRNIWNAYVTCSPCMTCVKLLLNTSCMRIIYRDTYPNVDQVGRLWRMAGREIVQMDQDLLIGQFVPTKGE